MTSDASPLREGDEAKIHQSTGAVGPELSAPSKSPSALNTTRAAAAWLATAVALVLLVLFIILILQNQNVVKVHYLGFIGSLPLGMALFISAVAGAVVVAVVGVVRLTQLRVAAHRRRRMRTERENKP